MKTTILVLTLTIFNSSFVLAKSEIEKPVRDPKMTPPPVIEGSCVLKDGVYTGHCNVPSKPKKEGK